MSISDTSKDEARWSRPPLERDGPARKAGGFYRTAEDSKAGLGGLPLTAVDDAVVAAVRVAYNVAAAQVDRSTRLAQRLRKAGDRAIGEGSDREALDATERLVFRTMMSALTWLEGAAAEGDSPLQRLLVAQYRLVGQMLGVPASEGGKRRRRTPEPAAESEGTPVPDGVSRGRVNFVLGSKHRRPVRARRYEVASGTLDDAPIEFYSAEHIESDPLTGRLTIDAEGRVTITLKNIERFAPPGLWKAAICDHNGMQIGVIEIEL
jgi:hypothetical protein